MKKINLLGQASSSSSESTTITNLGLIYLKPLLDIEPTRETQELFPGDDGVSGYSFIRIKGVKDSMQEKEVNSSTKKQVITPDASYLGLDSVTINPVDKSIDSNIKPENIKSGVEILGVEGEYAPVTKPIEITPSTQEQVEVPDMSVDGFDSVTVHAVDHTIDSNIKSENILKGVSILGVEGNLDLKSEETKSVTYSKAGDYSITPSDDNHAISKVDIFIKEFDLPDQMRYDLGLRLDDQRSATFINDYGVEFTEDDNTYILFCNEQADIANNLVGFGYFSSYIPYSYHTYDESYFKVKNGFVYVNATKLGGTSNSTGISITLQFKNHIIPAKCLYNCGAFGGISVGSSCQGIGEQAFWLDDKYCDFKRRWFKAHANNSTADYGTAYSLRSTMVNSSIYNSITIDDNIDSDIVIDPHSNEYYNVTDNYHIYHQYSGNAIKTDDTDSSYVDISKYTYKRVIATYDITKDLQAIAVNSNAGFSVVFKNGADNDSEHYKIVFHDGKTFMYADNNHDSSSGGLMWLMFKTDNPRVKEFAFYDKDSTTNPLLQINNVIIQKPLTLGFGAYYADITNNQRRSSITSDIKFNAEALSMYGFNYISAVLNTMNYASCYANNLMLKVNTIDNSDYTSKINSSGVLTVDLTPTFVPGEFYNSNYGKFNGPNDCSKITLINGTDYRKWVGNQMYDLINYIDTNNAGNHLYEFDMSELPLDYTLQDINLSNVGQVINGNKVTPTWINQCYNMMVSHNINSFTCTLGEDNIHNAINKTINICLFGDPSKTAINHSTTSPLSSDYVLNFYINEEYTDLDSFKSTMSTNFPGITINYYPMTLVFDTIQNTTLESGKYYGLIHSSRTRHSLIKG